MTRPATSVSLLSTMATNVYPTEPATYAQTSQGILAYFNVKNWAIENTTFYQIYDPDVNSSTPNTFDWIPQDSNGNSVNLEGIAAQDNNDPYAFFLDHALVRYNGKYYDPSYGTLYDNGTPDDVSDDIPFPSLLAWEDYSINGFSSICLLYTSPSPRDMWTSRMPSSA